MNSTIEEEKIINKMKKRFSQKESKITKEDLLKWLNTGNILRTVCNNNRTMTIILIDKYGNKYYRDGKNNISEFLAWVSLFSKNKIKSKYRIQSGRKYGYNGSYAEWEIYHYLEKIFDNWWIFNKNNLNHLTTIK